MKKNDRFGTETKSSGLVIDKSTQPDSRWYSTDLWWLLDEPQTSPPWHLYRRGRPTGSIFGYCAGHGNPKFSTPEEEVLYLSGQKEKTFTRKQLKAMAKGVEGEPIVRNRYSRETNKISIEVGLVIPTWELRIGSSVDGIIIEPSVLTKPVEDYSLVELIQKAEGILEIKCPGKLYPSLRSKYWNIRLLKSRGTPIILPTGQELSQDSEAWKNYYSHIYQTHFDQMQLGMAVLRKPWADYVVHAPDGIYRERISYCHRYFIDQLLNPVRSFLDERLDPVLSADWRKPLPTLMETQTSS